LEVSLRDERFWEGGNRRQMNRQGWTREGSNRQESSETCCKAATQLPCSMSSPADKHSAVSYAADGPESGSRPRPATRKNGAGHGRRQVAQTGKTWQPQPYCHSDRQGRLLVSPASEQSLPDEWTAIAKTLLGEWPHIASLIVHLDEHLIRRLKARAAANGRSVEAESSTSREQRHPRHTLGGFDGALRSLR
jgi:hypothetical protein